MNEHVREGLLDALEPQQVADLAGQMDTDDAVAIIEDSRRTSSARCCARWSPTIAPRSRKR
jgi:magnesium transporter